MIIRLDKTGLYTQSKRSECVPVLGRLQYFNNVPERF